MNPEHPPAQRLVDRIGRSAALDGIAGFVQPFFRAALEGDGPIATPVKNLLHGTWLGHSLHPIITDIPVGAWSVGAVCDALDLFGVADFSQAADVSIAIGTAAGAGAALTGWADWSDTKDAPMRVGIVHAALNGAAFTAYLASLALRAGDRRRMGQVLALGAYALVSAGAYLGGELSTGMQLGVRHTSTPIEPPDDFVAVCGEDELADGALKRVDLGGITVLLSRHGDAVAAVGAVCTHRGAPLEDGTREDGCVRCPWHGARFDLQDGSVREGPATFPLATFETRISGGRIELRATR